MRRQLPFSTHSFTAIIITSTNLCSSSCEVCTVFIIQGLTFSYSEKCTSREEMFQLNIYPQLNNYCTYIFLFQSIYRSTILSKVKFRKIVTWVLQMAFNIKHKYLKKRNAVSQENKKFTCK